MAEELREYRPGKWIRIVDGRFAGYATPEEVAAWKAGGSGQAGAAAEEDLDIDLGAPIAGPSAGPGRAHEAPLRPAFERRGRAVQPAEVKPTPSGEREPRSKTPGGPKREPPSLRRLEMTVPDQPTLRPRPAAPRPLNPPDVEAAQGPVLIRRKAAAEPPAPSKGTLPSPAAPREPASSHPAAGSGGAAPATRPDRKQPAAAPQPAPSAAEDVAPPKRQPAPRPSKEEAVPTPAAARGPSYWWIWNTHQQPVEVFLREWAPRYAEKFGHPPTIVICHEDDLAAAQAAGYDAQPSPVLQPGHFYLSHSIDPV